MASSPRIQVKARLSKPHPLIASTRDAITRDRTDQFALPVAQVGTPNVLNVRVSWDNLGRALRIMDALFKACEQRGWRISTKPRNKQFSTHIRVNGVDIEISIREVMTREEHVLTDAERERQKRTYEYIPRYDFIKTGKLYIQLDNFMYSGLTYRWTDSSVRKLEQMLDAVMEGIQEAAAQRKKEHDAREEANRLWLERRRREAEIEQQRQEELKRLDRLVEQASNWRRSQLIKDFIASVVLEAGQRVPPDELALVEAWATSALQDAERLDPITDILHSITGRVVEKPGHPAAGDLLANRHCRTHPED